VRSLPAAAAAGPADDAPSHARIFFAIANAIRIGGRRHRRAHALTAWRRRLTLAMLRDVCEATVRTTAMVVAILVGAFFLNVVIQTIGLTQQLSRLITAYQLSPVQVLSAVIVLYLVLGTFMEELSMMIATIPITTPLILHAGYDPVWYGILIVLLIQTAMVTPPFGINLFVIHGIRGRGTLTDVERGAAPVRHRLAADDRSDLRLSGHRDVAAATFRMSLRGNPPRRGAYNAMTMLPAASFSARAPGGTTQVASYSSTISGPARLEVRSARLKTGVSSQPCSSPK
jgi:hypothetical protein